MIVYYVNNYVDPYYSFDEAFKKALEYTKQGKSGVVIYKQNPTNDRETCICSWRNVK